MHSSRVLESQRRKKEREKAVFTKKIWSDTTKVLYEWRGVQRRDWRGVLLWAILLAIYIGYAGSMLIHLDSYSFVLLTTVVTLIGIPSYIFLYWGLFGGDETCVYQVTPIGIRWTAEQHAPEYVYSLGRKIAYVGIVGCIIVAFIHPLALAGAGGGALMSFKMKDSKKPDIKRKQWAYPKYVVVEYDEYLQMAEAAETNKNQTNIGTYVAHPRFHLRETLSFEEFVIILEKHCKRVCVISNKEFTALCHAEKDDYSRYYS